LIVEKEIKIARITKKKQEKEEDLIEIRIVKEIISRRFHKYLKIFKRKDLERIPIRKIWNYIINLRKDFVLKKRKIYLLLRIEREEIQEFVKNQLKKRYI